MPKIITVMGEEPDNTREIESAIVYRNITFERNSVDETNRTVKLAFSSEAEVKRWYGTEILDHNPDSVRLGRLMMGGNLLMDHDSRDVVGVIESATIDADLKGRAVVRFGNSVRACEIFQDVIDRIRTSASVGYWIHKVLVDEENDTYRAVDWEPVEISLVSVPADMSSGVGRSYDLGSDQKIKTQIEFIRSKLMPKPVIDGARSYTAEEITALETAARNTATEEAGVAAVAALAEEQQRVADLMQLGDEYQRPDLARQYVDEKKTTAELRLALLQAFRVSPDDTGPKPMELGLSNRDVEKYSIIRAISAESTNNWKKAGFELECSRGMTEMMGREARGFFVPMEIMSGNRAMNPGTAGSGAELVGTYHASELWINSLRNTSVTAQAGAMILPGLIGNLTIPAITSNAAFTWLNDEEDSQDSELGTKNLPLTPKILSGSVPLSRNMLIQSSPGVEMMVRDNIMVGASLGMDLGAIAGLGTVASKQPRGIINTVGVGATVGITTFGHMVDLFSKISTSNALVMDMCYALNPVDAGVLMQTPKDAGSGIFVMENMKINGFKVVVSNQMPSGKILFGNFKDLIIALWGVLDINIDTATLVKSAGIVLRAFQDCDITIRHPESFAVASAPTPDE